MNETALCYVFDLTYMPYSFDIYTVLGIMEYERKYLQLESICFVVLPIHNNGRYLKNIPVDSIFSKNEDKTATNLKWREARMVMDSLHLLPTIQEFHFFHSREEGIQFIRGFKHCYPKVFSTLSADEPLHITYAYEHISFHLILRWLRDPDATYITNLQPSDIAVNYVQKWCVERFQDKKIVVLNLREADYYRQRNSDVTKWINLVNQLDMNLYGIVVIRDFDKNHQPLPEVFASAVQFVEPLFNQDMRVALYQKAFVVLGDAGGTSVPMLYLPHVSCIYFCPELQTSSNSTVMANSFAQFLYKRNLLYTSPIQIFVYEKESAFVDISKIFHRLVQTNEQMTEQSIQQYLLKKKMMILEKDILFKSIMDMLTEFINIKHGQILAFYAIEILAKEQTESLQRLYYALCHVIQLPYNQVDKTTEGNQSLFQALQLLLQNEIPQAKAIIRNADVDWKKVFPYTNHWTHLMQEEQVVNERIYTFPTINFFTDTYTCPICRTRYSLNKERSPTLSFGAYLSDHQYFLCFLCLQPTKIDNIDVLRDFVKNYFNSYPSEVLSSICAGMCFTLQH